MNTMNWIEEVQVRLKRGNEILFAKDSAFLQDLTLLFSEQNHRVMVLWAFEFADETVDKLRGRYPQEHRLADAVSASKKWAAGQLKMRVAQRAILDAHSAAKEMPTPGDSALCHAVGQACGVVHTAGHAIGFPIYELTAIIRQYGIATCPKPVEARKQQYAERMLHWRDNHMNQPREWADFMMR